MFTSGAKCILLVVVEKGEIVVSVIDEHALCKQHHFYPCRRTIQLAFYKELLGVFVEDRNIHFLFLCSMSEKI
jgi:hypothetical protein